MISELSVHLKSFVTVRELAEYWGVDRKDIYKHIDAGTLPALRIGPRAIRIRTLDAVRFERIAKMRRHGRELSGHKVT